VGLLVLRGGLLLWSKQRNPEGWILQGCGVSPGQWTFQLPVGHEGKSCLCGLFFSLAGRFLSDRTVVFYGVSIPRYAPTSSESRAFKNCKRYINHQHQGDPYVCCNRKGTGRRCYQALHS
jgi:hypothetical protein